MYFIASLVADSQCAKCVCGRGVAAAATSASAASVLRV